MAYREQSKMQDADGIETEGNFQGTLFALLI